MGRSIRIIPSNTNNFRGRFQIGHICYSTTEDEGHDGLEEGGVVVVFTLMYRLDKSHSRTIGAAVEVESGREHGGTCRVGNIGIAVNAVRGLFSPLSRWKNAESWMLLQMLIGV